MLFLNLPFLRTLSSLVDVSEIRGEAFEAAYRGKAVIKAKLLLRKNTGKNGGIKKFRTNRSRTIVMFLKKKKRKENSFLRETQHGCFETSSAWKKVSFKSLFDRRVYREIKQVAASSVSRIT